MRSLLPLAELSIWYAVLLAVVFIVKLTVLLIVIFGLLVELVLIALSAVWGIPLFLAVFIIFLVFAYVFLSFLGHVVENDELGEHLKNSLSVVFQFGDRVSYQVQVPQVLQTLEGFDLRQLLDIVRCELDHLEFLILEKIFELSTGQFVVGHFNL